MSKLVKAHAIPEAFFRVLRNEGGAPTLLTSTPGNFPKRALIGVYDKEILCEPCERRFDRIDDYGIQVLLTRFHELFTAVTQDGQTAVYQAGNLDQGQLLRFLLAVLWRASVSKQPFYGRVSLGRYEHLARQAILDPNAEVSPVFSALLSRWIYSDANQNIAQSLLCPFRERWHGVNAYRIYLGEVVAYVKVDKRPFSQQLRAYALQAQPVLSLIARRLEESKDLKSMIHTVRLSDENVERARLRT